jgi:predicted ferric reductase
LTLTALLIAFFFLPLFLLFDAAGHLDLAVFGGLSAGVGAYCLMSLNLVLAARPALLERWMGGLDKLYWVHKWTGAAALVLLYLHETVDLEVKGQGATSGLSELAAEAGDLVFIPFVILCLLSLFKRLPRLPFEIPYAWWRLSHRFMGLIFAVGVFHQFFVKLPFDNSAMISAYLTWMGVAALAAFAWTQAAPALQKRSYKVTSVAREDGATVVRMAPQGRPLKQRPGQFALISFAGKGLGEPHPFTISSHPGSDEIEFSIKPLGDFTRRLRDRIEPGDTAHLQGAFGRFSGAANGKRQIWLAGGIGITPFLSLAGALEKDSEADIDLFYCVRSRNEAIGLERLEAAARRVPGFRLHLHVSSEEGRLDAETLAAKADPKGASLWFCGPVQLRKSLIKGLTAIGKAPKSVHFERFEFR